MYRNTVCNLLSVVGSLWVQIKKLVLVTNDVYFREMRRRFIFFSRFKPVSQYTSKSGQVAPSVPPSWTSQAPVRLLALWSSPALMWRWSNWFSEEGQTLPESITVKTLLYFPSLFLSSWGSFSLYYEGLKMPGTVVKWEGWNKNESVHTASIFGILHIPKASELPSDPSTFCWKSSVRLVCATLLGLRLFTK